MNVPDELSEEIGSEYGKGLVICLVKFAEHTMKWIEDKEAYQRLNKRVPNTFFDESYAVALFMNAASEHLYEIEVPEKWQNTEIGQKVKELQDFGLEIGHGFIGKKWTEKDVFKAFNMCREIALMIDRELGLEPDVGQW